MDQTPDAGVEILISLYTAMQKLHETVFEQGFKIQALEVTLRTFPETRAVYEDGLKQAKTPEALEAMKMSTQAYDALIALVRGGPHHSA